VAILAHAHLGHTPFLPAVSDTSLRGQVDAIIELMDAIAKYYGSLVKVTLIGHSVGAWMATQALKQRPEAVDRLFLLFPTVSQIAKTPNGRILSWMFRPPLPKVVSSLSIFAKPLPASVYSAFFRSWPSSQIRVLQSLVRSPSSIYSALSMAHEEMQVIRDIDNTLLSSHTEKIWVYFAEHDNWVAEHRETVVSTLGHSDRIVHCQLDIPHAFCLNHGEAMARQCARWFDAAL